MQPKKILASVFLSTALVLAPAGVASASPVIDTSPALVEVHQVHGHGHGHGHGHDHDGWKGDHDRKHDKKYDKKHDNHWRSDCYWWGPWLVCNPW